MRIEKIPKKVFGSNEEFVIMRLLYDNGDDKLRREARKVLFDVFDILPAELKNKAIIEDFEYHIVEEFLKRNSLDFFLAGYVFKLEFPRIKDSEVVFRRYDKFVIWFIRLDKDHFITEFGFPEKCNYTEFFTYRNKFYRINHSLNDDLIDDYPQLATKDLTNIIQKDKLVVYLKYLKKRFGDVIFVEPFDKEDLINFLDYLYPDIGGETLLERLKETFQHEKVFSDNYLRWRINDLIRFLYLSKKLYKQLKKEV